MKKSKRFAVIFYDDPPGDVLYLDYNVDALELIGMCETVKHTILTQHEAIEN